MYLTFLCPMITLKTMLYWSLVVRPNFQKHVSFDVCEVYCLPDVMRVVPLSPLSVPLLCTCCLCAEDGQQQLYLTQNKWGQGMPKLYRLESQIKGHEGSNTSSKSTVSLAAMSISEQAGSTQLGQRSKVTIK